MQILIPKSIWRSHEKYNSISDLKGDDLIRKAAFHQGWKISSSWDWALFAFAFLIHSTLFKPLLIFFFLVPANILYFDKIAPLFCDASLEY